MRVHACVSPLSSSGVEEVVLGKGIHLPASALLTLQYRGVFFVMASG